MAGSTLRFVKALKEIRMSLAAQYPPPPLTSLWRKSTIHTIIIWLFKASD
jgi:hypothetical protein